MSNVLAVRDFTDTPGPRKRAQGHHSGQEFFEDYLLPAFKLALDNGTSFTVDLDGVEGYATVFLDETFGQLARTYGSPLVEKYVRLQCSDDATIIADIKEYYRDADKIRAN